METIKERLTANKVMKQVDNLEHLFWNDEQKTQAIFIVKKSIIECDAILADILESDWSSKAYYKNLQYELGRYLNCLQIEQTPDDFLSRENPLQMPTKPPVESTEIQTSNMDLVVGMILFWIVFFLAIFMS